jgi:hypothetical protein
MDTTVAQVAILDGLSNKLQLEAIAKLEKLKELTTISKPYLLHLVDLDIPDQYKACA